MTFKEILQNFSKRNKERKEKITELDEDMRVEEIVLEKRKSSDLRELERYMKEDNAKKVKKQLEFMRKKREKDLSHNYNPLNAKNITNHSDYEILKEKKIFKNQKNMFSNQKNIFKNKSMAMMQ